MHMARRAAAWAAWAAWTCDIRHCGRNLQVPVTVKESGLRARSRFSWLRLTDAAISEFRPECHEQLAPEQVVNTVGVCRSVGDKSAVDDRRILVQYVIGAGAQLQDLVDVPSGVES